MKTRVENDFQHFLDVMKNSASNNNNTCYYYYYCFHLFHSYSVDIVFFLTTPCSYFTYGARYYGFPPNKYFEFFNSNSCLKAFLLLRNKNTFTRKFLLVISGAWACCDVAKKDV